VEEILVMKQSEFYDAQQGAVNEAAREHSETIFLKKFNNFIKTLLIIQFSRQSGGGLSVLDLCCGRGGDLGKWAQ
jgi:mRNA (guanine-N7-)-methyltransferase